MCVFVFVFFSGTPVPSVHQRRPFSRELEQTLCATDGCFCVCIDGGGRAHGWTVSVNHFDGKIECQDEENIFDASLVEEALYSRHYGIGSIV